MTIPNIWQPFYGYVLKDKYRLRSLIGEGGFGGVFLAEELAGEEVVGKVAVKIMRPREDSTLEMQLDELELSQHLNHPHILRCFATGSVIVEGETYFYMVLELAEESLQVRLQRGPLPVEDVRVLAEQMTEALIFLHGSSPALVHRDVTPGNILRIKGQWKLADFGLARTLKAGSVVEGISLGTHHYVPPEGFTGTMSPAWDIWSLGIVLVEALTGRNPFSRRASLELPHLPYPFPELILGCLQEDRFERWTAWRIRDTLRQEEPPAPAQPAATSSVQPPAWLWWYFPLLLLIGLYSPTIMWIPAVIGLVAGSVMAWQRKSGWYGAWAIGCLTCALLMTMIGFAHRPAGYATGDTSPAPAAAPAGAPSAGSHTDYSGAWHARNSQITFSFTQHGTGITGSFKMPGSSGQYMGEMDDEGQLHLQYTCADQQGIGYAEVIPNADGTYTYHATALNSPKGQWSETQEIVRNENP